MSSFIPNCGVIWQTPFQPEYVRKRNTRSGTKNIRCFPICSSPHNPQGWCGNSPIVRLENLSFTSQPLNDEPRMKVVASSLRARARFEANGAKSDTQTSANLDEAVSISSFLNAMRDTTDPTATWIPVQIAYVNEDGGPVQFLINPDLLGWHYGWRSNKSTANKKHSLTLYVYFIRPANVGESGESQLQYLFKSSSPTFRILSGARVVRSLTLEMESCQRETNLNVDSFHIAPTIKQEEKRQPNPLEAYFQAQSKRKIRETAYKQTDVKLDACTIISRQKVDHSPSGPESGQAHNTKETIRSLLSSTIHKAKRNILKLEDITNMKILEDDSFLGILNIFTDESFLDLDSDESEHVTAEVYPDRAVPEKDKILTQIMKSIQSDRLTKELSAFFRECFSGPIGISLYESLKQEKLNVNPILREFINSMFRRFQNIISKRLWKDLHEKGLVDEPWLTDGEVRGSMASTYQISKMMQTQLALLYDPEDAEAIGKFLEMVRNHHESPDDLWKLACPDNRFRIVNKRWMKLPNQTCWFIDILGNKLGYLNEVVSSIQSTATDHYTVLATAVKSCVQAGKRLASTGYVEIYMDGQTRLISNDAPLLQFIELPPRQYKAQQKVDSDGSYEFNWILWYQYSDISSTSELENLNLENNYICIYTQANVWANNPNRMCMLKRAFHMDDDPGRISIDMWKTDAFSENLDAELETIYVASSVDSSS